MAMRRLSYHIRPMNLGARMSIRKALQNLQQIGRRHGLRAALRVIHAAARKDFYRIHLFELKDPKPLPSALEAAREHVFRFAAVEEIEALLRSGQTTLMAADVPAARRGDRCLLQLAGETLVGYSWIAGSPLVHLAKGLHFNLPDDAVFDYRGYTAPEYRGAGFQALRHLKLLEHIRCEGKTRLFGHVEHLNFSSLKGVRKSGYAEVGDITIVKRGGRVRVSIRVREDMWCNARRL